MKNVKVLDNSPKQLTIKKLKTHLKAKKGIGGESRIFLYRLTHSQFEITRNTAWATDPSYTHDPEWSTREGKGTHGSRWPPRKCQFIKWKCVSCHPPVVFINPKAQSCETRDTENNITGLKTRVLFALPVKAVLWETRGFYNKVKSRDTFWQETRVSIYAVTRYQSANSGPQFLEIFLRKYLGVKPGITDCIDLCTMALLTRYLVIIQTR